MKRDNHAAVKKTPSNMHILKLSFVHFAVGMILLLAAMIMAIGFIPELAHYGTFRVAEGWLFTHMLLLGFASLTAIGASYQLIQVILRTSLFSRMLGWVHFVLYLSGLVFIIAGFTLNIRFVALGGLSIVIGMTLYSFNIMATLIRTKEWNPFVLGIGLSVWSFLATGIFGTLIGIQSGYGHIMLRYEVVFNNHLWLGIGGWLSGLILVFSFKLLPMFYVSSKKVSHEAYWIIGGFHLGLWLEIVATWSGIGLLSSVSCLLIAVVLVRFTVFIFAVRTESHTKQPIGPVRIAFWLIPVIAVLFFMWCGVRPFVHDRSGLTEIMIAVIILGWFVPSILSYLSRIIPFLWWAHRYRTKEEKKAAVLLSDMLPERRLTVELVWYLLGIVGMIYGYYHSLPVLAVVGQSLAAGCVIVYLLELARVFRY